MRSFDELVRATRGKAWAIALQVTRNPADADEVTQEALLSAWRSRALFRGESSPETWVYRIALHAALRVRARRRDVELEEAAEPQHDPRDALVAREDTRRVERALQELSVEHRTALQLCAVEALSHAEVASILGLPEGTVWSRLSTARRKLRDQLEPHREYGAPP